MSETPDPARFDHVERARTTAVPDAVWTLWSDPGTWPDWDPSVVAVALTGPFEAGTTGTMTLAGGIDVPVELTAVEPGRRYVDRLTMGELSIEIDHVVEAHPDGGSALVVTTAIRGPGAVDVGPLVTAEAPVALATLTATAEA